MKDKSLQELTRTGQIVQLNPAISVFLIQLFFLIIFSEVKLQLIHNHVNSLTITMIRFHQAQNRNVETTVIARLRQKRQSSLVGFEPATMRYTSMQRATLLALVFQLFSTLV